MCGAIAYCPATVNVTLGCVLFAPAVRTTGTAPGPCELFRDFPARRRTNHQVYALDQFVTACLLPLAVWILISGLDDVFLDLVCLAGWLQRRWSGAPPHPEPPPAPGGLREKRIAILVPLWREHKVIGRMLEHNLAAIRYDNYEVFVGAYPNDEPTLDAVRETEARFPKVHLAICPHNGPTSKADCLNWIYQRLQLYEDQHGVRFELLALHDAEDLVHPEELRWLCFHGDACGMVQIPVLPLPTPLRRLTHGVYCDEFAEFQTKDIPSRQLLGGFLPSNGVGTGYARGTLEKLAGAGPIFDPACLTEDYDIGFRLHRLGCRQLFVPIRFSSGAPIATREFFPQRFGQALRQRSRWVMGNVLQSWERHGWTGGWRQRYWLFRDRKGLVGYPVTALANLCLLYGALTWAWSEYAGGEWGLRRATADVPGWVLLWTTLVLQSIRLGVRSGCVARIYGWKFAAGVPLRVLWANGLNFLATMVALGRYAEARWRGRPLRWIKTDHAYPSLASLGAHKRRLGEILVTGKLLDEERLARALASQPPGVRLGEHLRALRWISEEQLYAALSAQHNVPLRRLEPTQIAPRVARSLPGAVVRRWRLLPVRISAGRMRIAGPELPTDDTQRELRRSTRLGIEFEFLTPSNFDKLVEALIDLPKKKNESATDEHG